MSAPAIMLAPALSRDIIALRQDAKRIGIWSAPVSEIDPPEVLDILTRLYSDLEANPGWGSWFIIQNNVIVGTCSLAEPPTGDNGVIGYSIYPASQGRGYATAAVAQMLELLRGHSLATVRAETSAGNIASERVLIKCGFLRTGKRFDPDDGELVLWQRAV